jgi:hypothetical protein
MGQGCFPTRPGGVYGSRAVGQNEFETGSLWMAWPQVWACPDTLFIGDL